MSAYVDTLVREPVVELLSDGNPVADLFIFEAHLAAHGRNRPSPPSIPQAGQDGELLFGIGSFGTSDEIAASSDHILLDHRPPAPVPHNVDVNRLLQYLTETNKHA